MSFNLSRRNLLAGATAVGALTLAPRAFAQDSTATGRGGVLRAALNGNGVVETLDPADPSSNLAWARILAAYDPLVRIRDKRYQFELAESIEPNADGSLWRFTLRENVLFHDGAPLTAADVLYTFTAHPSPFALAYFPVLHNVDIANTAIVSERELDLALLAPMGALLDNLTSIVVIRDGSTLEELQTATNGTGPFTLESFEPGGAAVYTRNETYWNAGGEELPLLDGLELLQLNESAARLNALLAGQIDVATALGSAEATQVESADGFSLLPASSGVKYTPGLILRVDRPPFDDPEVRRAVKMAVDRQQMLDTIGGGRGRIGVDLFVADGLYFDDSIEPPAYDPDGAKAIIDAAGLTGTTIDVLTSPVDAGLVEMATLFAAALEAIGLQPELEVMPADTYWTSMGTVSQATVKSMVSGVNSALEYAAFAYPPDAVFNLSGYNNPDVTDLIAQATASVDFEERLSLMAQVQSILAADGPNIVPVALQSNHAVRDGVHGLALPESEQFPFFDRVWIE